jgi:uncharacterized protein
LSEWLIGALALMLIFEGLLPFLSPGQWRQMFLRAAQMHDGQIRFIGLLCLLCGCALLWWLQS